MKLRLDWVDIAKGITIILIVLQHVLTYYPIEYHVAEPFMISFRVPFFFIVSGFFFKTYTGLADYTKRKVNGLIVPFVFFYLAFTVLFPNLLYAVDYDGLRQTSSLGWTSIFNFWKGRGYSNNPVWFLLALFWVSMIFYGIKKISDKTSCPKLCLGCLSILVGAVGYIIGVLEEDIPMNMDNALTATPLYYLGYTVKNGTRAFDVKPNIALFLGASALCFLFCWFFTCGVDYLGNRFPADKVLQVYGCAVVGTLGVCLLSMAIKKSKLLVFYGKNSLTILCMQMPVIQVVHMVPDKLGMGGGKNLVFTFVVTTLLFLIIIPVMNKVVPWVTGKKNLIK